MTETPHIKYEEASDELKKIFDEKLNIRKKKKIMTETSFDKEIRNNCKEIHLRNAKLYFNTQDFEMWVNKCIILATKNQMGGER